MEEIMVKLRLITNIMKIRQRNKSALILNVYMLTENTQTMKIGVLVLRKKRQKVFIVPRIYGINFEGLCHHANCLNCVLIIFFINRAMYLSSQDPPYMVGLFIPYTIYTPDILLHVIILTTNSRKEMVVIINRKCFKIVALLVTFMFLLTIPASFAQAKPPGPGDPGVRIAEFWIGKPYYDVNGVRHNMDVAPYLKNDTTMLPFRYVGYALGLDPDDVVWDEAKRQVRITRGEITVKLDIGKKPWQVNDLPTLETALISWTVDLPVAPEIKNDRTMVPFRYAAQALGGMVFWDGKTKKVTIETWEELPPRTKPLEISEVVIPANKNEVSYIRGLEPEEFRSPVPTEQSIPPYRAETVTTDRPIYLSDGKGWTADAIECFKLYGIPESSMLFDPVQGGLLVRGTGLSKGNGKSPFGYLYVGDKFGWDAFGSRWPHETNIQDSDTRGVDPIAIKNEIMYTGDPTMGLLCSLFSSAYRTDPKIDALYIDH